MGIRTFRLPLATAVGADDSAVATVIGTRPVSGELVGIKIVQSASPDSGTGITITITDGLTSNTLLTLTSYATVSKWIYPLALCQGVTGADLTTVYTRIPMDGTVTAAITGAKGAQTVQVTLQYQPFGDD